MTEIVGWLVVLGLGLTVAAVWMLSIHIKKHARNITEGMIVSTDIILAHLKDRLPGHAPASSEPVVGVVLERRCSKRRGHMTPVGTMPQRTDQRRSPGRRMDDFVALAQAG